MARVRLKKYAGTKAWHKTARTSTAKTPGGLAAAFLRRVRFENEQYIYELLSRDERLVAHIPSVLSNKLGKELIIADIASAEHAKKMATRKDIAEILALFNGTKVGKKQAFRNRCLIQLTSSRFLNAIKGALNYTKKYLTRRERTNLCWLLIKLQFTQRRQPRALLLHNDLHSVNILEDVADNNVYLIDFELASLESKWILADIIFVAFDRTKFSIDEAMVRVFLEILNTECHIYLTSSALKNQVRFGVILRLLDGLKMRSATAEIRRQRYANFLKKTCICDRKFDEWFSSQDLACT